MSRKEGVHVYDEIANNDLYVNNILSYDEVELEAFLINLMGGL